MTEPARAGLVLVGTPIGNLGDLSERALLELRGADSIACEDTRRTGRLLAHFAIPHQPFIVCNEHTEREAAATIVERISRGQRVVLVSDAGMPAVSDPGERIVRAAVEAGLQVTAVPGPSAVLMALAISGFSTDRFVFEGFLPRRGSARSARLESLRSEVRTAVVFEAPHRLVRTVQDLEEALGAERRVALARELTKRFEEIWRGSLGEALHHVGEREPRGEFVLVLEGAQPVEVGDEAIVGAVRARRAEGATHRDAVASVARDFDVSKRRVYELALADTPGGGESG